MFKRIALLIFSVSLLFNMCGCVLLLAGAAGGVGTAAWLSEKLSQEVNASFEKSIKATTLALGSLKLDVKKKTQKDDVAQIISKYTDGKTIWIDIRVLTSSTSKIEVRVGATGDKNASRKILDRIIKYL